MAGPPYLSKNWLQVRGVLCGSQSGPAGEQQMLQSSRTDENLSISMARHNGPFIETLYVSSTLFVMLKTWHYGGHSVKRLEMANTKRLSGHNYITKQEKQLHAYVI